MYCHFHRSGLLRYEIRTWITVIFLIEDSTSINWNSNLKIKSDYGMSSFYYFFSVKVNHLGVSSLASKVAFKFYIYFVQEVLEVNSFHIPIFRGNCYVNQEKCLLRIEV